VVFLIDDDRSVLSALSRLFQATGYQIKAYSSAEKFLDEHDPSIPGCVVLDLWMPGFEWFGDTTIAGASSNRAADYISDRPRQRGASVAAMKAGAVDFLLKPINQAELFDAVERAKRESSRPTQNDEPLEHYFTNLHDAKPRPCFKWLLVG
jgi:FixJ family two-component response regulator